ncbi:MAG: hypothetical protein FWG65_05660 [Turicibacter sp.]|nr:hypothetical protein [Turicibacter sp.]
MIKTELTHNPYLLETTIKFNNNPPKINSLVEKYITGKLQTWLLKLPNIFYNEMNGWDFDVDFSGTKIDFEALRETFAETDKGEGSVNLFHKNELESVWQKRQRIAELLAWLADNRNRKFDYDTFLANTTFDDRNSLIAVSGAIQLQDAIVENITHASELEHVALDNIAILFFVTEKNRQSFRENLHAVLQRNDIIHEQLFFHISEELGLSQMQRIITEMVPNPQIVNDSNDSNDFIEERLAKYFEVYPQTAYVQRFIVELRAVSADIEAVLAAENEINTTANSEIRRKIEDLDEIIHRLKATAERIHGRNNFEKPDVFTNVHFLEKIDGWNRKKVKITSDEEAGLRAVEFQKELGKFFAEFVETTTQAFDEVQADIGRYFAEIYATARFDIYYAAKLAVHMDFSEYGLPKIVSELLELNEEKMVEQSDYLGNIKSFFGSQKSEEPKELRRVVEYKYDEWREYAKRLIVPILDKMLAAAVEKLIDFYNRIAEDYFEHLKRLIEQQTQAKEQITTELSDDERRFQADMDWFDVFQEKLREIERG